MGDGNLYQHMDEQLKVQCKDCHSQETKFVSYDQLDLESKKIFDLRNSNRENEKFLITEKSKVPLVNTYVNSNNEKYLVIKSSIKKLNLNPPKQICIEGNAHKRLKCQSCHTEWVTHCVGCQTEYDPKLEGYDLLDNKEIIGSWNEFPSDFFIDYPVLGIKKEQSEEEFVDTFIPGMILTIDKFKNPREKIFKRLFARTFSHTINKNGRSCKSWYNNPMALGYGKGKLSYIFIDKKTKRQVESFSNDYNLKTNESSKQALLSNSTNKEAKSGYYGRWIFTPQFENRKEDNLPKDDWIEFLKTRDEFTTTRTYTRPFTIEEQKRILLVGACLTCPEEESKLIEESLIDFESVLSKVTNKCILAKN